MKTIQVEDGYKFGNLIRYNNQLYLINNSISDSNTLNYYLLNIVTEEKLPLCSYEHKKNAIINEDKIFVRTSYRIDNNIYVTKYHPLVFMIPYAFPDSISYTENLGLDLLEGVMVSTKNYDRCPITHYGSVYCHFNHLACITRSSSAAYGYEGLDALVLQQYIKYKRGKGFSNSKEVTIYQPQHGIPKTFELFHSTDFVAIHPTEPLAVAWDYNFCTLIDLEL